MTFGVSGRAKGRCQMLPSLTPMIALPLSPTSHMPQRQAARINCHVFVAFAFRSVGRRPINPPWGFRMAAHLANFKR